MGPLLDALRQLGARCQSEDGKPPVAVTGPLVGSRAVLPGDVSSQFITGLLIACPLKDEATELHIAPPRKSQGYVALTIAMQAQLGIKVAATSGGYHIPGGQAYRGSSFTVPGD
jgi:3-phosphoshikimate 1-carboxyvinyltransferase